jgi:feruloyl esterase
MGAKVEYFAPVLGILTSWKGPLKDGRCSESVIKLATIEGLDIVSLQTQLVYNDSVETPEGLYWNNYAKKASGLNFCQVTVTYGHSGQNDAGIKTIMMLPLEDWNGRIQALGGGGFIAGTFPGPMKAALSEGYAVVSTDAGVSIAGMSTLGLSDSVVHWGLLSKGNPNIVQFQNFASRAISEAPVFAKAVTQLFYGRPARYTYFNGCSTGGRQAYMLAQRYPNSYDGLLAGAPAINWAKFLTSDYFPQLIMNQEGKYPRPCEMRAITHAAIKACDGIDGVVDDVIMSPDECLFDPFSLVGQEVSCEDGLPGSEPKTIEISPVAATAAKAAWTGYRSLDGKTSWYGVSPGANLTGPLELANTVCGDDSNTVCGDDSNTSCHGAPFEIAADWIRLFVLKDKDADLRDLTHKQFDRVFQLAVQEWSSWISTDDPDMRTFAETGGKLITWHGLDDQHIQANGTREYYLASLALDPHLRDYHRYFPVPGIGHCFGGRGAFPGTALSALIGWVEDGIAPDVIYGRGLMDGKERPICAYPKIARWTGDPNTKHATSFECVLRNEGPQFQS